MRRFTDEELSRILSEHSAQLLKRGGSGGYDGLFCMAEAAFNLPEDPNGCARELDANAHFTATPINDFDNEYDNTWSAETFLRKIEGWFNKYA